MNNALLRLLSTRREELTERFWIIVFKTIPLRLLRLPLPKCQKRTHIRDILQALEEWNEMQEVVVRGIADPAFDGDCIICSKNKTHIRILLS